MDKELNMKKEDIIVSLKKAHCLLLAFGQYEIGQVSAILNRVIETLESEGE